MGKIRTLLLLIGEELVAVVAIVGVKVTLGMPLAAAVAAEKLENEEAASNAVVLLLIFDKGR